MFVILLALLELSDLLNIIEVSLYPRLSCKQVFLSISYIFPLSLKVSTENIQAFATPASREAMIGTKERTARTTLNKGGVGPAFSTL